MKIRERISKFFYPEQNSPPWRFILPFATLIVLFIVIILGGIQTWEYTNSSTFCGSGCHTMVPEDVAYRLSPHSNVACEECHMGRASFFDQLVRKTEGIKETYYEIFKLYEYPLQAKALRPSVDTCEKCHRPETFSDDSLRLINHYADDRINTASRVYLVMKTGGGDTRQGNARGIHWHTSSKVLFYSDDPLNQTIPYIRVYKDDNTFTEYTDVESGFDPSKIDESKLKRMDCITCHNRITHSFKEPSKSVDESMANGLIDPSIPLIHTKAVSVLSANYATRDEAVKAISEIEDTYKNNLFDYYSHNGQAIKNAVSEIQAIYDRTVFHDQKIDSTTHPNNLGHINSPGCYRCHDGKHMDDKNESIRLECNICHAIPVVAKSDDFLTNIEIGRGIEPQTHFNRNWISMHNQSIGPSCSNCHNTKDPGGTSNTSFCSNSACHGTVFTYAGFDAPALREIIKSQLPPPEPKLEIPALTGDPTFDNYVGILFTIKCTGCHTEGDAAPKALNLSTYAAAMKGGEDGAIIVPGDSANSQLIKIQSADHFVNFTIDELNNVIKWIAAGAPEK